MGIHMVGCTCPCESLKVVHYRCTRDLRQVFMDAGSQGMRLRRDSRALGQLCDWISYMYIYNYIHTYISYAGKNLRPKNQLHFLNIGIEFDSLS